MRESETTNGRIFILERSEERRRLAALSTAAAGTVLTFTTRRWTRVATTLLAVGAIVAVAASGHAASTASPTLATAVLAVHLVAVGIWVFGLTTAVVSTGRLRNVLSAFAPYAIAAAITVAVTGIVSAVLELNDVSELLNTSYGNVVLAKASALFAMAVIGLTHNRWRQSPARDAPSIRDLVFGELGIAAVAVILAVVLVSFPNPPREAAIAEQLARGNPVSRVIHGPAVTLADPSGPFIVGLTLQPPQPGPIEVHLQVIGVEAGDALRNAVVHAATDHNTRVDVPLRRCGVGCFEGSGILAPSGTWQLRTAITSNRGPIQTADTIRLSLHVLAATIWVGGQITLAALVPALKGLGTDVPRAAARASSKSAVSGSTSILRNLTLMNSA